MEHFRFLKWQVYKDAKTLFGFVLKIVKALPKEYRFEVGSQAVRSALSVVLNIAEGSGKGSDRELNHFFDIALGSLFEILAVIDVLKDNRLLTDDDFRTVGKLVKDISNQLGGFKKKIRSTS